MKSSRFLNSAKQIPFLCNNKIHESWRPSCGEVAWVKLSLGLHSKRGGPWWRWECAIVAWESSTSLTYFHFCALSTEGNKQVLKPSPPAVHNWFTFPPPPLCSATRGKENTQYFHPLYRPPFAQVGVGRQFSVPCNLQLETQLELTPGSLLGGSWTEWWESKSMYSICHWGGGNKVNPLNFLLILSKVQVHFKVPIPSLQY